MKHLFYIALSFLVFTACEDEKDTLPYPMNELDDTFWTEYYEEVLYYDENGTFLERRRPSGLSEAVHFFFKGSSALWISVNLSCAEGIYSYSQKENKIYIQKIPFNLEVCNKSWLVLSCKAFPGTSPNIPSGCSYLIERKWYCRSEPEMSWEEYVENYKRSGDYVNWDE